MEYVPKQHRQHLIYLARHQDASVARLEALYRDKIDQHQAALAGIKQDPVEAAASLAATTGHFSLEGAEERRQTTAHTAAARELNRVAKTALRRCFHLFSPVFACVFTILC